MICMFSILRSHTDVAIHACVWCWGKPVAHLMKYHLLQWAVAKVKPLMNSNMTLTVLNLHKKIPKGATTKIRVIRHKIDIREIK